MLKVEGVAEDGLYRCWTYLYLSCLLMHSVQLHDFASIATMSQTLSAHMGPRKAIMFAGLTNMAQSQSGKPSHQIGKYWLRMAIASFMAAMMLSACGGGDDAGAPANFNIGVTVGGQFVSQTTVAPGGSLNLAIHVGQSLVLDAGEPAVWTLLVGGSAVTGGAQVFFAGANITATTLNRSSVVIDTSAAFPLRAPIPITLVATSTFDSVQVATVNLLITN